MSESISSAAAEPADHEALKREFTEIETCRRRYKAYTTLGVVGGIILFVVGEWNAMSPSPGFEVAICRALGIGAFCFGVTAYALYRGRHPAWGVLAFVSLPLLELMPDLAARRLDQIDGLMTGRVGTREAEVHTRMLFLLSLFFIPAPVCLLAALWAVRKAWRTGSSLFMPIAAVLWCGFFTYMLGDMFFRTRAGIDPSANGSSASLENSRSEHASTTATVMGRRVQARLLPGWNDSPALKTQPGVEIAFSEPQKDLHVLVSRVVKRDVVFKSLDEFAARNAEASKQSLKSVVQSPTPTQVWTDGRRTVEYELRGSPDGISLIVYDVTCRETATSFWLICRCATPSNFEQYGDELRRAAANVVISDD